MLREMLGEIAYAAAADDIHSVKAAIAMMKLGNCQADTIMDAERRFKRDAGTLPSLPAAKVDPLIAIAAHNATPKGRR